MSLFKSKTIYLYLMGVILYAVLAFAWGTWPRHVSNPPAYYTYASTFQCLAEQPIKDFMVCKSFGYPKGSYFVQSWPYYFLGSLFERVFHRIFLSLALTANFFLLLGFLGTILFLVEIGVSWFFAISASFLFLVQPFMVNQICYETTTISFTLVPLLLYVDLKFLMKPENWGSRTSVALKIVGYALLRVFMLLMDGYGFMMASLCTGLLLTCYALQNRDRWLPSMKMFGIFIFGSLTAVLFYKAYVPNSANYELESADYFRAQGVDLFSLLRPSTYYGFYKWIGFGFDYDPFTFYGDSSNVRMNFSGYLPLVLTGWYVFKRKISKGIYFVLMIGIVSFLLSLGPSLKINSRRTVPLPGQTLSHFTKDVALMKPSEATFNFHTESFYMKTPGIQNMRAVYRWISLTKLALLILSCLALMEIAKRRRVIALLLWAILLLEYSPDFPLLMNYYTYQKQEIVQFNDQVIEPLKANTHPGQKIYYLSDELDYFADYMTAKSGLVAYSVSGDKSIEVARKFWPQSIQDMRDSKDVAKNIHDALYHGLVDYIMVPNFDLRWDAYFWPPAKEKTDGVRAKQLKLIESVVAVKAIQTPYFTLLMKGE